ncbi:MAG TPA: hypothetical protein VFW66_00790 [Gemmatimonadales bacterium]|nr:hypothetical protein [Gemmatimonadales bacterium]
MKSARALSALLLASLLATVVSCSSGNGPTAPTEPAAPSNLLGSAGGGLLGTGIGAGLLACKPLPYAYTEQTIGPAGGTIDVGPHALTIPAGALTAPVLITAEAPVSTVNSVKFGPEGLHFAGGHPARLTMSYANCPLLGQLLPKRIAYTSDLLRILSYLISADDLLTHHVSADVEHFSRYAVAW